MHLSLVPICDCYTVNSSNLFSNIVLTLFAVEHPLPYLEDLYTSLYDTQFPASSFTVTSITPELAKCLSLANFIPILDELRTNRLYYAPYFAPILAALKDRLQVSK